MDVSLQPHHLFFDELVKEVPDSEFGFVHRKSCFQTFDLDGDNLLSAAEFLELCRALFRTANSEFYGLDALQLVEIFTLFDTNKDGYIDSQEFVSCWEKWIRVICYPRCVLLVVDVQNDFISGTLALHRCPAGHRGEEVVPAINKLVETIPFHLVVYSLDWHPQNHVSFIDNVQLRDIHPTSKVCGEAAKEYDTVVFSGPPPMEQKLWPRHCVQGSLGSQLHPDLKVKDDAVFVHKGVNPEIDSYSAFWDNNKLSQTELHEELTKWDITDVFCCGIAYDVCVGATAMDAVEYNYRTILIDDASRGISVGDISNTQNYLRERHALVVDSSRVKDMVLGRDRNPVLGYAAAIRLRKAYKDSEKENHSA